MLRRYCICAQNMLTLTFLGLILNTIRGGPIWPLEEQENLQCIRYHTSFKNYKANGYEHNLDFLDSSLIICIISYKYVQREKYPKKTRLS